MLKALCNTWVFLPQQIPTQIVDLSVHMIGPPDARRTSQSKPLPKLASGSGQRLCCHGMRTDRIREGWMREGLNYRKPILWLHSPTDGIYFRFHWRRRHPKASHILRSGPRGLHGCRVTSACTCWFGEECPPSSARPASTLLCAASGHIIARRTRHLFLAQRLA